MEMKELITYIAKALVDKPEADKDIRPFHCVGKSAGFSAAVGLLTKDELIFVAVEPFTAPVDDPFSVAHHNILHHRADIWIIPDALQQAGNRETGLHRHRR